MNYQLEINKNEFKSYRIYKVFDNGSRLLWVAFMTHKQAQQFLNGK